MIISFQISDTVQFQDYFGICYALNWNSAGTVPTLGVPKYNFFTEPRERFKAGDRESFKAGKRDRFKVPTTV